MKKLLIASVSVLALSAGAAFAGGTNSSTVTSYGSADSATIDQKINAGTSNTSDVYQGVYGNGEAATNSQVSVTQIGGVAVGSTTKSTIVQNDNNQKATVSQDASLGGSQISEITQYLSGYAGADGDNTAKVTQLTAATTDIQKSTVNQTGYKGSVIVSQSGAKDVSTVNQSGYYNNPTDVVSLAVPTGAVPGGVNVIQSGDAFNTSGIAQASSSSGAYVLQDGTGGTNGSTINQNDGSYQAAYVNQTAGGAAGSNSSIITQGGGNGNSVGIYQTSTGGTGITQTGSSNTAYVNESAAVGGSSSSTITQTGNSNYAGLVASGEGINTSTITQTGNSNSGSASQTAAAGVTNTSTITQTGNGHYASVTQH